MAKKKLQISSTHQQRSHLKKKPLEVVSTPPTPSTDKQAVEGVESVEATPKKPQYRWEMEAGLDKNFSQVGKLLASMGLELYRYPDGGLLLVEEDRPHRISSAKELAPLLIDNIRITVTKNGKYHGERIAEATLNNMLLSRSFLHNFRKIEEVVSTPIVLADYTPSQPGYNEGGILHLGPTVTPAKKTPIVTKFLNVMAWQGNADRTNAVAAALTMPHRLRFPGGKPLVLLTATKSHAGKTTLSDFIQGGVAKAEILYESIDWPMQRSLQDQLVAKPEIGVICCDNVRRDSSGRAKIIRSGFLESFVTSSEIVLSSAASKKPVRTPNKFVMILNTNDGSVSIDLLNRSLPIRLSPNGDVTELLAKSPIGNPRDFLRNNRRQIEAELWGMVERWRQAGCPLDESVAHYPMTDWAKSIGGILRVNGFKDFLANYSSARIVHDPIREALGVLAFHAGHQPSRVGELAKLAITEGLDKVLLAGVNSGSEAACQRAMGMMLSPYVGETFTVRTAAERITYRLKKQEGRFGESHPHFRYTFEEIKREAINDDDPGGLVLEERCGATESNVPALNLSL